MGRAATGHPLANGIYRWTDYAPDIGITIRKSNADKKSETATISWPDAEKRLRRLIAEGRYLTPEELEQYRQTHPDQMKLETAPAPEAEPPIHVPGGTPPIPAPARGITQADIDAALQEWNGDMDSKRRVQQYMTDHARDRGTAEWLRNEYGDDFPAYPVNGAGAATDLPWTKVQRHLARLVKEGRFFTEEEQNRFEDIDPAAIREHLEQAGDKPSAFVEQVMADVERIAEQEADEPVTAPPTVREIYDHYKPMVKELVLADAAYQNACRNSDRETAIFEGDAAVKRAALTITEPDFMRLYYDMQDFRYRLHREIVDETYPVLSQPQQEQNSVPHHETLDTSGVEGEAPPWGTEVGAHSPWGKVQVSDQFADGVYEVSTAGHGGIMIREADAEKLLSPEAMAAGGHEYGWRYYEEDEAAPIVIRELLDRGIPAAPPYVRCEYTETGIFEEKKIYSVHEFDRLMKQADDRRIAGREAAIKKYGTEQKWMEANDPEFDEFFGYDKVSFTVVLPDGTRIWARQDVGDGYGGMLDYLSQNEKYRDFVPALRQAAEQEQPPRDPMVPAYRVGDTVYLDGTAYEITDINLFDVQLRDPTLSYPILRSEPIDRFEMLLRRDAQNGHITEFLGTSLEKCDPDMRDVLVNHLLTQRDKDYISGWLRSGEGNTRIGQRLSDAFAGRSDTIMLETGEHTDYFTSTLGIEVHILDEQDNKKVALSGSWKETVYIFRTLYQKGLDGFTHEPIQRPMVRLEGKPVYQVGDKVVFPYGNQEISSTIGWIGETGIRIDAGPYSWSHETISRDVFEEALRQDERNAGLFAPEAAPTQEFTTETATVYPAEPNHLPYDVVIQTLKIPEQEREPKAAADQAPATGNFRITDDDLGVGSPKEKFRRNMEAINTLQAIELEGRSATPAEQEILSRYVGWGGLADAFDPDKPSWKDEFLELQAALTPQEYASARASTLNAHYTRPAIIKAIYEAVERMGFKTGNILDESVA